MRCAVPGIRAMKGAVECLQYVLAQGEGFFICGKGHGCFLRMSGIAFYSIRKRSSLYYELKKSGPMENYATSCVQCEQRFASSGMSLRHCGHGRVLGGSTLTEKKRIISLLISNTKIK